MDLKLLYTLCKALASSDVGPFSKYVLFWSLAKNHQTHFWLSQHHYLLLVPAYWFHTSKPTGSTKTNYSCHIKGSFRALIPFLCYLSFHSIHRSGCQNPLWVKICSLPYNTHPTMSFCIMYFMLFIACFFFLDKWHGYSYKFPEKCHAYWTAIHSLVLIITFLRIEYYKVMKGSTTISFLNSYRFSISLYMWFKSTYWSYSRVNFSFLWYTYSGIFMVEVVEAKASLCWHKKYRSNVLCPLALFFKCFVLL